MTRGLWTGLMCVGVLAWAVPVASAKGRQGMEFFEKKIRPVLVAHCYSCHSVAAKKRKGGLLLDSRDALRRGGRSGAAVVPGKVKDSLLIDALRYESPRMPPREQLPAPIIADFVKWVEMGAPDPRDHPPDPKRLAQQVWETQFESRRKWWSFQPVAHPRVPGVQHQTWCQHPIDRFILAKLEEKGLKPAPRANRTTLLRRLSFALTGLPPQPAEIDTFLADSSPDAWSRLVDRLLASSHFGERWARHWMDVVRYADTYGYEWDIPAKGAWRYRDYLIRAFNSDVPYDQLVREHIAGDLLQKPRIHPQEQINESLIGPMFFQLGEKRHGDSAMFNGIHQEMLDNKIDAFSKAFQGMTVACARCHDHKRDPISQREYYALAGVFMSSRWVTNTLDTPQRHARPLGQLKQLKAELRKALGSLWRTEIRALPARWLKPGKNTPLAKVLQEASSKAPPLEDIFHPWHHLQQASQNNKNLTEAWQTLADRYASEHKNRQQRNARLFTVVADFRENFPEGWSRDGVGVRELAPCGDFTVALNGDEAVEAVHLGGLVTNSISSKFNGALRTPYLRTLKHPNISFEVSGGDFAAHRVVVDNAFLAERQQYLRRKEPGWQRFSTFPTMKDRHVFLEFATKTSNPNFPPRVGLGGRCTEEQAANPRSWFAISRVLLHEQATTPVDELQRFTRFFQGKPPTSLEQVAHNYARWFGAAVDAWSHGKATEADVRLINYLLNKKLLTNHKKQLASLVDRYRAIEAMLKVPRTVNGLRDLDPGFNYPINIRGDYDQLGEVVPRGYLRVLAPGGKPTQMRFRVVGSGRRELAERVANPRNPLTARVFVNRVWHWLFGTGLVATPNDFGKLGAQPSHPELLDYLAHTFVEEGWSLKKLIRMIVLSETWRQSGITTVQALNADPNNRLLHHYPLRRLEAEAIRDALLAVSGRLDSRLHGPTINPHRSREDPQKRLFSGPLDGKGRRSCYIKMTIMEPPRFLATFNQPKPKLSTGKRDVTTTTAQSLALLNDPLVLGQAEHWARRLVQRQETPDARLVHMFRVAVGRTPTPHEIQRWQQAVRDFAVEHRVSSTEVMGSTLVWKDIAHTLFNTKEFIYIP